MTVNASRVPLRRQLPPFEVRRLSHQYICRLICTRPLGQIALEIAHLYSIGRDGQALRFFCESRSLRILASMRGVLRVPRGSWLVGRGVRCGCRIRGRHADERRLVRSFRSSQTGSFGAVTGMPMRGGLSTGGFAVQTLCCGVSLVPIRSLTRIAPEGVGAPSRP